MLGRALGKITVNGCAATAENILPSAAPSTRQNFFFILPSARIKSTQQRSFAKKNFVERTLPSATLDKAFAECKGLFAECKNTRQSRGLQQGWDKLGKRLKGSYRTRFTFELIW